MKKIVSLGVCVCAAALLSNCSYYSQHFDGAMAGNAKDQYAVGVCYDNGDGVPVDKVKAAAWYLKAANQGHADAQNNLGLLYRDGKGVDEDYDKAAMWFEKAAKQGNKYGQYNLGRYYLDQGCDYEHGSPEHRHVANITMLAAQWFSKAAAQGHRGAQYMLARCYDEAAYNNLRRAGGVIIDLGGDYKDVKAYWALAKKWYKEAASDGDEKYVEAYKKFIETGSSVMASINVGADYLSEVAS